MVVEAGALSCFARHLADEGIPLEVGTLVSVHSVAESCPVVGRGDSNLDWCAFILLGVIHWRANTEPPVFDAEPMAACDLSPPRPPSWPSSAGDHQLRFFLQMELGPGKIPLQQHGILCATVNATLLWRSDSFPAGRSESH